MVSPNPTLPPRWRLRPPPWLGCPPRMLGNNVKCVESQPNRCANSSVWRTCRAAVLTGQSVREAGSPTWESNPVAGRPQVHSPHPHPCDRDTPRAAVSVFDAGRSHETSVRLSGPRENDKWWSSAAANSISLRIHHVPSTKVSLGHSGPFSTQGAGPGGREWSRSKGTPSLFRGPPKPLAQDLSASMRARWTAIGSTSAPLRSASEVRRHR